MPDHRTPSGSHHVLVPINIQTIRELDHKAVFDGTRYDRRLILLAAAPPHVRYQGEWPMCRPGDPAGYGIQRMLEHDEQAFTELLFKVQALFPGLYYKVLSLTACGSVTLRRP